MGYMTFNGVSENVYNLTVKDIKRDVLPEIRNRFEIIDRADGTLDYGTNLGNRIIQITFQNKTATSKEDIHGGNIRDIALWLFPEDRLAHQLTISDEPGIYYNAKVASGTPIDELYLYGEITITFECTDPYRYSTTDEEQTIIGIVMDTSSNNNYVDQTDKNPVTQLTAVGVNSPQFNILNDGITKGLYIEKATSNKVANSGFKNRTGGLPSSWSISTAGGGITGGIQELSITDADSRNPEPVQMFVSSWNGNATGYYGIIETDWTAISSLDEYSGSVWCRLTEKTGDIRLRIRLYFADVTQTSISVLGAIVTSSTNWIELKTEDVIAAADKVYIKMEIGFYANNDASSTGTAQFIAPMLQQQNHVDTYQTNALNHDGDIAKLNFWSSLAPNFSSKTWGIGITIRPRWNTTDDHGAFSPKYIWCLYEDDDNYIEVRYSNVTDKFEAAISLSGSEVLATIPAMTWTSNVSEIKLYMRRDNNQFKAIAYKSSTKYDSGYTADARAQPIPSYMQLGGKAGSTWYADSDLYDLIYDEVPNEDNYFAEDYTNNKVYYSLNNNLVPTFTNPAIDNKPIFTCTFIGTGTEFRITNEATGEYLHFDFSIANGDVLVINSEDKTAMLNGSNGLQYLDYINSRWFNIEQGETILTPYTDTTGGVQVNASWTPRYY